MSRAALAPACLLLAAACGAGGTAPGGASGPGGAGNQVSYETGGSTVSGAGGTGGSSAPTVILRDASLPLKAPLTAPDGALVTFAWPETAGGDGGSACRAGHYKGTFQCNYVPAGAGGSSGTDSGALPFVVTGPVEFNLTQSQNGEFLEVSGGTLNGSTFVITFTGDISGKLDCRTQLFDGMVTNGQYGIAPFPPGGYFQGPTTATYTTVGPALINGAWQFNVQDVQNNPQGSCDGTWTATYAP